MVEEPGFPLPSLISGKPGSSCPSLAAPAGLEPQGQKLASPGRACPLSDIPVHTTSTLPPPLPPPTGHCLEAGPTGQGRPVLDEALVLLMVGEGVPREGLRWRLVVGALQEDPGRAHHHDGCHHEQAESVHCAGHSVPAVLLLGAGARDRVVGGEGS